MTDFEVLKPPQQGRLCSRSCLGAALLIVSGCAPESVESVEPLSAPVRTTNQSFEPENFDSKRPSPAKRYLPPLAAQDSDAEEMARLMSLTPDPRWDTWIADINEKVTQVWNQLKPKETGFECEVRVSLLPSMEVINAEPRRCDADDATRSLIILAVGRASPLPKPPEPEMFEKTIILRFKPSEE